MNVVVKILHLNKYHGPTDSEMWLESEMTMIWFYIITQSREKVALR